MVLSLQGCMAVGKTTALRYLETHAPELRVSYEDNAAVIEEVRRRRLDKTRYEDYINIQRLWLQNEIDRYERVKGAPCTVMDFGAEEIEFYTLCYPESIGQSWPVADALADELAAVRRCMPARILFLDASEDTLRQRRNGDATRSRTFFEHHLTCLLPLKRAWFAKKPNVDWLNTDGLGVQEVGERVIAWARACMKRA